MNEHISNEDLYNFIIEYEMLCQKYKISIDGCGCYGSPFIFNKDFTLDNIHYDKEENKLIFDGTLDFKNKKFFRDTKKFKEIIDLLSKK